MAVETEGGYCRNTSHNEVTVLYLSLQTTSDDVIKKLYVISKYKNKFHQMKLEHQNIGISRIILRLVGKKIEDSTSENHGSYQNI